ncbi:MAG: hypothetical protein ABI310_05850 [Microbacteriaceae bacterium]
MSASLAVLEDAKAPDSLPALVSYFDDDGLTAMLTDAAALRSEVDAPIAAGTGVVAKRSDRELGHAGLAARNGHRSAAGLIQSITGSTQNEAWRQVRLGEAMGASDAATRLINASGARPDGDNSDETSDESNGGEPAGTTPPPAAELPWSSPKRS